MHVASSQRPAIVVIVKIMDNYAKSIYENIQIAIAKKFGFCIIRPI